MKQSMLRLQVIGLKPHLMPVIEALHRLGCMQIERVADLDSVSARPLTLTPEMVRDKEKITRLAARTDGLIDILGIDVAANGEPPIDPDYVDSFSVNAAIEGLETVSHPVKQLVVTQESLLGELSSLPRYEATLRKLLPVVPSAASDPQNAAVSVMVGRAHRWVFNVVAEAVQKITEGHAQMATNRLDENTEAMIIVVPRSHLHEVENLLGREDISRLRLPQSIAGQPPDKAVAALGRRLAEIPEKLEKIDTELAHLAEAWGARLLAWRACLRDRLDEINLLTFLGETEHTFVIVGWIPRTRFVHFKTALEEQFGDDIWVEQLSVSDKDQALAPVILENTPLARPFESLVRLFRLPLAKDVDPTLLISLFMPIFFGMILGDIGYGVILLLMTFVALRRYRQEGMVRDILKVLALGAGWSILFGVLYGEAFGTLGEHWGLHPLLFDRADAQEVTSLLIFAIGVGIVHILLGLLIGIWVAARDKSRSHLLERGGMFVGLIGLFLFAATLGNWLPLAFRTPGILVLLLGIVLLSGSYGWMGILLGPIEFVGVLGNILSYLRIAAVGLASVYVARLANDLAGVIGSLIVGVLVAVLIHALNLVLGAFSPTIHSLRLHYVEFFRKFYEGGGRPFTPFRSRLIKE